jgi:hypothetical protein
MASIGIAPGFQVPSGKLKPGAMKDVVGVFTALSDREKFSAVRVGEEGRSVAWPEPTDDLGYPMIEIESSALIYKSQQQHDSTLLDTVKRAP